MIKRYRLERRPGDQWTYVHAGTFERPIEERNFTAVFVGGPRNGETTTFRDREDLAASLFPGYRLCHDGADPLAGWQMRHDGAGA